MKVLHVVKTSDGAAWAAKLARVLCNFGVEVHAALPRLSGRCAPYWQDSGAIVHEADLNLPVRDPLQLPKTLARVRDLVAAVQPDLIHSHFVGTTLALRWALGKQHFIPRLYHVAGPLHLEHALYRNLEIRSAGAADYWIGSSRCIGEHYRRAGVPADRVYLSYYGDELPSNTPPCGITVRDLACARPEDFIVGNISWMYPPKRFLGQRIGLKAHEDIIAALGLVIKRHPRVLGVFAGGAWGGAARYEHRLRKLAHEVAGDRIRFLGELPYGIAHDAWRGFDLAVHVPISENCGGVIEPLLAGIPVIASRVGGLPEVIVNEKTGWLVPPRDPQALAAAISRAIADPLTGQTLAARGRNLVRAMFNVQRTGREVFEIYRHILGEVSLKPREFLSGPYLESIARPAPETALPIRPIVLETD
ncbi:MAG TPA: glycosyltransferase family 4 protein [bacterium]